MERDTQIWKLHSRAKVEDLLYLLASHPTSENISRQMFPHERLVRMFVMKKVLVTLTLNLIGSSSMGKINKYNSLYVAGYYTAKN